MIAGGGHGQEASPGLAPRVLALAASGRVGPEQVGQAVRDRLACGSVPTAQAVVEQLERRELERRQPTATTGATAEAVASGAAAAEQAPETLAAALAGRLDELGASVLVPGEPGYPPKLADAWPELGAPLWLFAKLGEPGVLQRPAVAVVGTRRASLDGLTSAQRIGRMLGEHGVAVVSGLARGIDQAAHRGALEAGGPTVGVLGAGLAVDYPRGDRQLRDAVQAAGGLVTEYTPDQPPRPRHFLWRNRIIAGLADLTVVAEGRARSGALTTARLAGELGRQVMAVPGSPSQPTAEAPLALIRDGVGVVARFDDVLEALDQLPLTAGAIPSQSDRPAESGLTGEPAGSGRSGGAALSESTQAVWELLGPTPASPGALAATCGRQVGVVLAAVSELTAAGLAEHTPKGVVAAAGSHAVERP